jgi:hypothetical protein
VAGRAEEALYERERGRHQDGRCAACSMGSARWPQPRRSAARGSPALVGPSRP